MAGYGDELIGSALAKGAHARGKRIAFGDGRRILWGPHSGEIFKGNPNIAAPGSERDADVEWIRYHKGHRIYAIGCGTHWKWNKSFNAQPGEVFLDRAEIEFGEGLGEGFVVIEPNVPWHKAQAQNKDWGLKKYQSVATELMKRGYDVVQFAVGRDRLAGVRVVATQSFRHSLAVLRRAALAIVPEGGLHHAAAAVGVRAVVLFGGFIPPGATGYAMHVNLTGGARACGSITRCDHCQMAMAAISIDDVLSHADGILAKRAA
jgi:hypothetical protein